MSTDVCPDCGAPTVRGLTRHGRFVTVLDLNPSPAGIWTVGPAIDADHHAIRRLAPLEVAVATQDGTPPLHQPPVVHGRGRLMHPTTRRTTA